MRNLLLLAVTALAFAQGAGELKQYPLNNLDGVLTRTGVALDRGESSDGGGSLRIDAKGAMAARLFESGDLDIENARLIYQARVRTRGLGGRAYLEMWCAFPGKGEFFSRGLHTTLSGTTEWSTLSTVFFLKPGENPSNVRLNLAIEGQGTVWIDDIRLIRGPLE